MNQSLRNLPIDQRIQLVEELWDSIAVDQQTLPLTEDQLAELNRRLDVYELDGDQGQLASDVIDGIRKRL